MPISMPRITRPDRDMPELRPYECPAGMLAFLDCTHVLSPFEFGPRPSSVHRFSERVRASVKAAPPSLELVSPRALWNERERYLRVQPAKGAGVGGAHGICGRRLLSRTRRDADAHA